MTKSIFIFIAAILLLLPIISLSGEISTAHQLIICTPFLLFLGIPHGAIDNILYLRNNRIKNAEFIGVYLVFVGLNVILWIAFPSIAYLLFLLLSAYHFGQSQFSHYFSKQPITFKIFYLSWGVALLSGLIYFNLEEIHLIMAQNPEFAVFSPLHQENFMFYLFLFSSLAVLSFMVYHTIRKSLKPETLLMEVLVLALVLMSFKLMPLLIGFTLYFVILHSFKVLREEYNFLISQREVNSFPNFLKVITPFTLFSVAGIAFLYALIYLNILSTSYGYCLLIVISSITLPHVFVMNRFYQILFKGKFYEQYF